MKYWNISGREADQARRMVKDIQYSKRHKDLQELHIWREQMRKGANDMSKINELRRMEGYLAHLQPGSRIRSIQNQPHIKRARDELLASIGLQTTPA